MTEDLDLLLLPDGRLKPLDDVQRPGKANNNPRRQQGANLGKSQKRKKTGTMKHRFTMLNNFCDVTLRELSRNEIAVWLNLFRDTRDGIACSSQMELARRCGVSDRTIRRTIKSLEDKGLLQISYRGSQGKGMSKYRIKGTS